jgi:hypothetical protein
MSHILTLSKLFARLLMSTRLAPSPEVVPDLIEVRIPHPDLDLDDFWAFPRTAE